MKLLYAAMKYDYGRPEQGFGFEHHNFYDTFAQMGHDILYFDFMTLIQQYGRGKMNRLLWDVVVAEKPDLMFTVLFTDEFEPKILRKISEETDTITLNWFCDDHWRFDNFSHIWAPCFNWAVTTARSALPKYAELGYENVIKSQWGCNHFSYRRLDLPLLYDITFVGQPHGNRRRTIEALGQAGLKVNVWGTGWETGRLSQEEMIRVFNQSRVNLNLSNASVPAPTPPAQNVSYRILSRALDAMPFGARIKALKNLRLRSDTSDGNPASTDTIDYHDQIKGRNFEIPGCGGFVLTGMADNLDDYYEPGKEIICFTGTDDLIAKAQYYLRHDDERQTIAEAGYQRTQDEHTYAHRFANIFNQAGLPVESSVHPLVNAPSGHIEEIT
ncbi:MAG: glycosyltransferase [Actinomycetota bacterium]|nr:glycosyltransferase [Actinomycetota bacterium]